MTHARPDPRDVALPSPEYARYVLALMACVTVLNVMDRQVLSILIEPIKHELGVSDAAMGLLTGLSFALFHAAASIPIAIWADRWVRRTIIALGLAVWSGLTLLTGLARGYGEMFAIRVGVGVGEATGGPPAQSLLSDYFPHERRATALGVLVMGGPLGSMVAYAGGGWINEWLGWRAVFLIFGGLGLIVAPLIQWTIREPRRGQIERLDLDASPLSTRAGLRYLFRLPTFRHLVLGTALNATGTYAFLIWAAPFLMRVHRMGTGEAGTYLALGFALVNAFGVLAGGRIGDRMRRRDERWLLWVPALSAALAVPFAWGFLLSPPLGMALVFLVPTAFMNAMYLGPIYAAAQNLSTLRLRALAAALIGLMNTVLGLGIGPPLVGWLNDLLNPTHGAQAIRYSLALLIVVHFWGSAHLWLAARTLPADLAAKELGEAHAGAMR